MSEELDELFGADGPRAAPRTGLATGLLVTGLLLALVGLVCTSAPGGLVVLAAWAVVERDLARIDSGYLSEDDRPRVRAVQRAVLAGLVTVVVLFFVQSVLLCTGFYDLVWTQALAWLFGVIGEPG